MHLVVLHESDAKVAINQQLLQFEAQQNESKNF